MNDNFYNSRKIQPVNISNDVNKNGNIPTTNFSHNQISNRQTINHNSTGNHLPQNILPQLVNLVSPQLPVSQSTNQTLINMGFNAASFLPNQLYSIPNTFGALNTIASQSYGANNTNYMNNMRINHSQPSSQALMNNKTGQDSNNRKLKSETLIKPSQNPMKSANYPVRLLVNSELVGPLIGRKGEKIKEITANTGAKIDIKRESVPYSQFGLNNYMFSGCNRKGSGLSGENHDQVVAANGGVSRGESQIVFIVGEPEKCSAAIADIMQLCCQEAREQGRDEPNMGLLAEDRFCARLIGKEGRFLNWVRAKSGSQVHVSNVPTITTLSEQPHVISLDRIISCRGGGLASLLDAEKLISDKIRQCVAEDSAVQKPPGGPRLAKDDSFLPPRASGADLFGPGQAARSVFAAQDEFLAAAAAAAQARRAPHAIGSGIVHRANPNWPDNLKLDENLYVRIPQACAGSIIGSEGKSVRRIMADTGTYIQISKTNLGPIESIPAVHTNRKQQINPGVNSDSQGGAGEQLNERLITIKGTAPSQCSALTHIFSRVRVCYSQASDDIHQHGGGSHQHQQQVRLWIVLRVPKLMLGRLIGKEGKVIRQLQLSSRTFLSFPRLRTVSGNVSTPATNGDQDEPSPVSQPPDETGDHKRTPFASHSNETLHNPDWALFGDSDLHPVEIFGTYEAVEAAIYMIRRLVYSSIFSQFGPALIPGPTQQLVSPMFAAAQQMPHSAAALLMPPPPPMLLPTAALAQRRNGDCGPPPFVNNLSSMHPAFMHQPVRGTLPPGHAPPPHHISTTGAAAGRNYKKALPSNQRSKLDQRVMQSEPKSKTNLSEFSDSKKVDANVDLVSYKDDNDINGNSLTIDSECSSLSPRCILMKRVPDSPSTADVFAPDASFAQSPVAASPLDLNPLFQSASPCSFYTDCGMNMSANDELSFITATQDSFPNLNSPSCSGTAVPVPVSSSTPVAVTHHSSSNASTPQSPTQQPFSHWSGSPSQQF